MFVFNHFARPLLKQCIGSPIYVKTFSTSRLITSKIDDGSLSLYLSTLLGKTDTANNGLNGLKDSLNGEELDTVMSLISELKKCEEPAKDAKEVLDNIAANPTLASFLIPSKRSLSTADYCAYYLLSPLMQTLGSVTTIETLTSYYMRVQSDKRVRSCPLSPPQLQLKPKKHKDVSTQTSTILSPEECLSQLDIRVGRIVEAWNHPDSDKLICERVDVGEPSPRSIGSGIRAFHSAESMVGRLVCVMCNMKTRKLAGYPSNGMLLCASTPDHLKGALIQPPDGSRVGERIQFDGIVGEIATPNQVHKKKMVEMVLEYLKTNQEGVCCFKDKPFRTSTGVCTCVEYPEQQIS